VAGNGWWEAEGYKSTPGPPEAGHPRQRWTLTSYRRRPVSRAEWANSSWLVAHSSWLMVESRRLQVHPRSARSGPPPPAVDINVIPAKAGIQNMLKMLDSPVSGTGQAQSRASLARNDKKVIATQSPAGDKKKSRAEKIPPGFVLSFQS